MSPLPTKYLGVPLDRYRNADEQWVEQISKLKGKADAWQGRQLSMFSRAGVCNVFLLSRVWYVMNVLCASSSSTQRIHRVFAVFVWASTWEKISRSSLFFIVKRGGVGLVHLFLRQVVSRFMFLRNVEDPVLRTAIHTRLRTSILDFIISSCNDLGVPSLDFCGRPYFHTEC